MSSHPPSGSALLCRIGPGLDAGVFQESGSAPLCRIGPGLNARVFLESGSAPLFRIGLGVFSKQWISNFVILGSCVAGQWISTTLRYWAWSVLQTVDQQFCHTGLGVCCKQWISTSLPYWAWGVLQTVSQHHFGVLGLCVCVPKRRSAPFCHIGLVYRK